LINDERFGEAKFWALNVDDCTDYCWRTFVKSRDQLKTKAFKLVELLKDKGRFVKFVSLDDAGK
jgi:hypothetical protein